MEAIQEGLTLEEIRQRVQDAGFNDCVKYLRRAEAVTRDAALKPLRIAVLRSYTVEPLEPVLRLRLLLNGIRPEFFFGGYNGYMQEVLDDGSPLYAFSPDIVLVLVRIEELLPDFCGAFASRPAPEWASEVEAGASRLASIAGRLTERLNCQVLIQNMCLEGGNYFGAYDSQGPEGQPYLASRLNALLAAALNGRPNAFIWDYERFVKHHGYSSILDPKMWYTSKNPFRQSAYPMMAADISRHIMGMLKRVKKCVVLDLDNTLWGGVAGEDGLSGVALGQDYPGNCYLDFQRELLKLCDRGIILALNSKNNPEDALEIIEKHPYMVLRKERFAAMRINWNDKASNMRALACELNIGLDSMIFIDDNAAECALVRQECPEVEVVSLPEKPYLIPEVVSSLPLVENLSITAEDRKKSAMYRAQARRKECEAQFEDIEEFLRHLGIEVTIEEASDFNISRIAQLTQKTNQMNLTTRRYTEGDIRRFASDAGRRVFSVASRDRFGDNGVIGVFILDIQGELCSIDTFLLSCRVIGRRIEDAMAAFIAAFASENGARTLKGEYIPTAKNRPAAGMYERLGFERAAEGAFTLDLEKRRPAQPGFIKLTFVARENS